MAKEQEGRWITVNGRHVLLKEGQSVEDAIKNSKRKETKERAGRDKRYEEYIKRNNIDKFVKEENLGGKAGKQSEKRDSNVREHRKRAGEEYNFGRSRRR